VSLLQQIACLQAVKAATFENYSSSQQDSLTAALAVMHDSLGQLREGAAATAGCFEELQVCSDLVQPPA
jgi:hypothetical protein